MVGNRFSVEFYRDAKRLHDIPYISRYNHWEETVEMERFIQAAADEDLHSYLTGIFYDSKACLCVIETVEQLTPDSLEVQRLHQLASAHISQFDLLGAIGHRN